MYLQPAERVKIKGGGVDERLKPAVLKNVRVIVPLIQINTLRLVLVRRFGVYRPSQKAKCATDSATRIILCDGLPTMFGDQRRNRH